MSHGYHTKKETTHHPGKYEILQKAEANSPYKDIGKEYGVAKSTVSKVVKRKKDIAELYEENSAADRCRKKRKTKHSDVNEQVLEFCQSRHVISVVLFMRWACSEVNCVHLVNLDKGNTCLMETNFLVPWVFPLDRFHCSLV